MVHTARVMRVLRLLVAQRRSDLQVPRVGSQEIVNLIDRIFHSFRLRVYNPTHCLIVMHAKKRERNMLLMDRVTRRRTLVDSPTQVADLCQTWIETEASEGFMLTPTLFPGDLDDFVALVVPELQQRDLFRTAYAGHTLHDHLGLKRPAVPTRATRGERHRTHSPQDRP